MTTTNDAWAGIVARKNERIKRLEQRLRLRDRQRAALVARLKELERKEMADGKR